MDEVKLNMTITVPTSVEASADMPDKWADGLTNNAERINDRRKARIPDEGSFQAKIATPSSAKWSPMLAPGFVSDSGQDAAAITAAQYKNLANNFNHWNDKLDLSFGTVEGVVAARFKDQVNNSKDNWATEVAVKTLRSTGDKIRGRFLSQAPYWMTGDVLANQMTNAVTLIAGAPYNFLAAGLKSGFRAGIMGKITQALIIILNSDFLVATVDAQNVILNAFCDGLKDAAVKPFVQGGGATDSILDFEYAAPVLNLHVQLVEV